jgi:hypothetical protein
MRVGELLCLAFSTGKMSGNPAVGHIKQVHTGDSVGFSGQGVNKLLKLWNLYQSCPTSA